MSAKYFLRDQQGSVLVEVTIMLSVTLVLVLGAIDFLLLFYQWNAAAKAVQIGARLAAVSDPVASGLNRLSQAVVSASVPPGAAMPIFVVTCDGRTANCTCNGVNACGGMKGYNGAAMNTIVFGRGSSSCSDAKSGEGVGKRGWAMRAVPAGRCQRSPCRYRICRFNFSFCAG